MMPSSAAGAPKTPPQRASAKQKMLAQRAFQKLWVAGTMGAFFTAFARNLPTHLSQLGWPIDLNYTLDIFLRYAYLLWLLSYFFVSNLKFEADIMPDTRDLFFDVVQSVASLTAAFFLDFLVNNSEHRGILTFAWPNAAILVICFLALILFKNDPAPGKQKLRAWGCILSGVSLTIVVSSSIVNRPTSILALLFLMLMFLFLVLFLFLLVRVRGLKA